MLAENDRELLTAYVDGEASARQRKAVLRLLRKSNEARTLLSRLQADARQLRGLPRCQLPPEFTGQVIRTISQRGARHGRRDSMRLPPTVPIWTALAAAAAVLLIVGAATFYLFAVALNSDDGKGAVATPKKEVDRKDGRPIEIPKDVPRVNDTIVRKDGDREPPKDGSRDVVKNPPDPMKELDPPKDRTPVVERPEPMDPMKELRGAPFMEPFQPDTVEVILPEVFHLKDVSIEMVQGRLLRTLAQHDAFYVEVLCKDGTASFPRVQAAFKAVGIELIVDSQAQARLKATQFRSNYAMLAEDLKPAELVRLFEQLGKEEADKKKPGYGQFVSDQPNLVVTPLTPEVRKKLSAAFGHETAPMPPPAALSPFGTDLYRPIADQTADQVVRTLSSPTKTSNQRFALAVPHGVVQQTPEVKKFFDTRTPVRKDTVQIYVVLRGKL